MVLGHLVVLLLAAAAALSGSSLSRWAKLELGAEHLLATMLSASAILLLPIHALGVTNALRPASVLAGVLGLAVAVLAATREGERLVVRGRSSARALWDSLGHGRLLLRELWAAGPIPVLALGVLLVALGWATLLTYVCPSDSWDGVWYHDLMVGYAIQQHGYAHIELPGFRSSPLFQQANGYPRNSEMLSLFFALFTGRTWLELPSVVACVPLALSTYLFTRRLGQGSRVAASMWATAIVLLPGVRLEMRSTYVDNAFAAFNLAAFYFASDAKLDRRRAVVVALCLGLALGTKGLALLSVPPLALLALVVLFARSGRKRLGWTLGTVLAAIALVLAIGGPSYFSSWHRYQNPFWPVTVDLGSWHFPGLVSPKTVEVGSNADVLENLFKVPVPGRDYVDTRSSGYGIATGVVLLPLAFIGLVVLVWRAAASLIARLRKQRPLEEQDHRVLLLLAVGAIGALTLWKSPALWAARYNVHGIALLMAFASVPGALRPSAELSRVGAATAVLVANVLMWLWSEPGWGVKWPDVVARLRESPAAREARSPLFVRSTIEARDRELRPGDLVVWSGDLDFASALYNRDFSNRLKYVDRQPVERAEVERARWLALPNASADAALARARADRWQAVGLLHAHRQTPTMVFRRVGAER